jgi:hypothetical protein
VVQLVFKKDAIGKAKINLVGKILNLISGLYRSIRCREERDRITGGAGSTGSEGNPRDGGIKKRRMTGDRASSRRAARFVSRKCLAVLKKEKCDRIPGLRRMDRIRKEEGGGQQAPGAGSRLSRSGFSPNPVHPENPVILSLPYPKRK